MWKFPITRRKNFSGVHEGLDPVEDKGEIFEQLLLHEFPVEFLLSAEIAQLHAFIFPNGSALLHKTGQFEKESLKRLDDTRAILTEMGRDTFDSPRADMMAEHLNKIHGFYDIPNEEFLHTLSTFIYDVVEFIDAYGWRKLTQNEKLAIYHTYVQMGEMMHIQNIPDTFEGFHEWREAYEQENAAYAETNKLVAEGLFRGAKQMVPFFMRPFLKPITLSLAKTSLVDLLGLRQPSQLTRAVVQTTMTIRRFLLRYLTLWDVLDFEKVVRGNFKSYPYGFDPLKLGPTKLINQIEKEREVTQPSV